MSKAGRKKAYHSFDADFRKNLTPRQNMYLDANYGKGVYGKQKYKEVLQELKIIEKGDIYDIDFLMAKREFSGDKRQFNKLKINVTKKVDADQYTDKYNDEGERLNSYIPLNDNFVLAYLTIDGYNGSPIDMVRILSTSSLGDFANEE